MVAPTAEQLAILTEDRPGFLLVRGAAGSGKTTTALLRLRQLCTSRLARRARLGHTAPVRVLVLTYNRTLSGYIKKLAEESVPSDKGLELEVSTFAKWAVGLLGYPNVLDERLMRDVLRPYVAKLSQDNDFLIDEVDYLLGRFAPGDLSSYVTARRDGRGTSPRMETPMRLRLLNEVVLPYQQYKQVQQVLDWNDVAHQAGLVESAAWDVVIVDEAQDFSANQARAVVRHLAPDFNATFVIDATQRIYARYFSWREAGVHEYRHRKLENNYRNTRQIAAFAQPLVVGLPLDDDGSLPDFSSCSKDGELPMVLRGRYSQQIQYVIEYLKNQVDLSKESVAFLQPRGGGFFNELRAQLDVNELKYCELTRKSSWPTGDAAIALCTLYSAKGLEFDHVIVPGLSQLVTPHGAEEGDSQLDALRRLVAMGIGRARRTVHVGFKESEASTLIGMLDPATYRMVDL